MGIQSNDFIAVKTTSPISASAKTLQILTYVINNAPVSLTQLDANLEMPRSTIYRGLQTLCDEGWIATTICKSHYFATQQACTRFTQTDYLPTVPNALRLLIHDLYSSEQLHSSLSYLTKLGTVRLMNSTDRSRECGKQRSLVSSGAGLASIMSLTPIERIQHMNAYLKTAHPDEQSYLRSKRIGPMVRQAESLGYIWSNAQTQVHIPFHDIEGRHGCVTLYTRRSQFPTATRLQRAVSTLRQTSRTSNQRPLGLFCVIRQAATQEAVVR